MFMHMRKACKQSSSLSNLKNEMTEKKRKMAVKATKKCFRLNEKMVDNLLNSLSLYKGSKT